MKELTTWTDEQFRKMREEMDRLFRDFLSDYAAPGSELPGMEQIRIEVREEEAVVSVLVEFPGLDPGDLEIAVSPEMVVIEINRSEKLLEGARQVRRTQRFARRIQLPCRVDSERAEALWLDHRLEIRMPKSGAVTFRKITPSRVRK